ncbi:glycosyltransferase family protein [Patescibacteria group bacterium]|nr:glycosyltransferase family protein [Patescibacteria group bacterium]
MKIVAIIQARMGSTRLPGKMMMDLAGAPVIHRVFERVKLSRFIDEVWLATTVNPEDDILAEWAAENGVLHYRGSENDVLDRYYQTAILAKADAVVRITGDCPLQDYQVIDNVIGDYLESGDSFDYVCNTQPPTYPDGLDTEVFSFLILEKAWQEAKLESEREHVTPYIWKHTELFKIKNITHTENLSDQRWTLDTKEDVDFIRLIVEECKKQDKYCGLAKIMQILSEHPEWCSINAQYQRNEGYAKSVEND